MILSLSSGVQQHHDGYREARDQSPTLIRPGPSQTELVMTIDALHGPLDRVRDPSLEAGAIGAADANIFLCPRCTRPLAVGVSRCAGCRTRLVAGVQLLKVGGFVGLGLAAGLAVGGGMVALTLVSTRPVEIPVAQPPVAVAPSVAPVVSAAPPPIAPVVPSAALSALRQSTIVNQRLLADADLLAKALAGADPSASEIATLLRGLASNAAFGDRLAPAVAAWDDGDAVSQGLAAFYASVGRIAEEGLAASLTNERAYVDAGRQMLAMMDGLTDLDAASRGLAAGADVELPPLVPASR
jgi:hypothetical protein